MVIKWLERWRVRAAIGVREQRAKAGGYFWLPCAVCDEYFGGNEWNGEDSFYIEQGSACGVCSKCGPIARSLTLAQGRALHNARCEH